ncbi:MAG: cytochrome c oxidase subunit II [Oscillatoriales cyanobacterium SM2_2_1]|nr:cytochrome c oxidase subunit II [Oscillatoriales cyanobacterium SM2_2_1]
MKRKTAFLISILLALVVVASIWYGRHHGLLPAAAGKEAVLYDRLFGTLIGIAFGLFLIVQGVLIYSLIKFRRKPGDTADAAPMHENLSLELVWTAVPTVLVMWVAIYSFDVYTEMRGTGALMMAHQHHHAPVMVADASGTSPLFSPDATTEVAEPLALEVQAMQFAWIFNYPGDVASAELHVPTGRRIRLNFAAMDVLHAFWVPELRLKQDTIPGTPTHLEFTPQKTGEYSVVCAELCGSYHGGMRATMVIQTPEEYQAWLTEQQELAQAYDGSMIAGRLEPSLDAGQIRQLQSRFMASGGHLNHSHS